MEPPIFFAPPDVCSEDQIELPSDESRHARTVLRLKEADQVCVVDGLGIAYRGAVVGIRKRGRLIIKVHSTVRNYGEPTVKLTLAAGLSVGYKFSSIVQKGTELGVSRFVPLLTAKSKVKIDEPKKAAAHVKRLERVALASIKQCRRSFRPEIVPPTNFSEYLDQVGADDRNLVIHPCNTTVELGALLIRDTQRVNLLVGPESGFSSDEFLAAQEAGFKPLSLGPRILRTENAAPVACALIMRAVGELS